MASTPLSHRWLSGVEASLIDSWYFIFALVPSNRQAFDRLMLLIATFIHYPGVGCPDHDIDSQSAHDSLEVFHYSALRCYKTQEIC